MSVQTFKSVPRTCRWTCFRTGGRKGWTDGYSVSVADGIKVDKHARIHKPAAAPAADGDDNQHTRIQKNHHTLIRIHPAHVHQYKRHRRRLCGAGGWWLAGTRTRTHPGSMPGLKPARLLSGFCVCAHISSSTASRSSNREGLKRVQCARAHVRTTISAHAKRCARDIRATVLGTVLGACVRKLMSFRLRSNDKQTYTSAAPTE